MASRRAGWLAKARVQLQAVKKVRMKRASTEPRQVQRTLRSAAGRRPLGEPSSLAKYVSREREAPGVPVDVEVRDIVVAHHSKSWSICSRSRYLGSVLLGEIDEVTMQVYG